MERSCSIRGGGVEVWRHPSRPVKRRVRPTGVKPVEVTCHLYVRSEMALFVGASDGQVFVRKRSTSGNSTAAQEFWLPSGSGSARITTMLAVPHELKSQKPLIVTGAASGRVRIWDPWLASSYADEPTLVQTLTAHKGTVTSLGLATDARLVTAATDGAVCLWKRDERRDLLLYPFYSCVSRVHVTGGEGWCGALAVKLSEPIHVFVGDSRGRMTELKAVSVAAAAANDDNKAVSSAPGVELRRVRGPNKCHKLGITRCLLVPEDSFVATISFDGTMRVFDLLTGNGMFGIENVNETRFTDMAWSAQHKELFVVDAAGFLQVWSISGEHQLLVQQVVSLPIVSVSFGLDETDEDVLVATADGVTRVSVVREENLQACRGHEGPVLQLTFLELKKDEKRLFSASMDDTMRCWDPFDMACLSVIENKGSEMSCVRHLPESNIFFTGHENGLIKVWNIDSGSCVRVKHHQNTVTGLAVVHASRKRLLVSVSFDTVVAIWNITGKQAMRPLLEHHSSPSDAEVLSVAAVGPTGHRFVTGGNDCMIRVWNTATRSPVGVLEGHTGAVTKLRYDGEFILSASDDHTVRVWAAGQTQELMFPVFVFEGHSASLRDLIVIPNYGWVVSCAGDKTVQVWEYHTGGRVVYVLQNNSEVNCLLWDEDEELVWIGTDRGEIAHLSIPAQSTDTDDVANTDTSALRIDLGWREPSYIINN